MDIQEMTPEEMGEVSGGAENTLITAMVKCPVNGCGFECNTFGELNKHIREQHLRRH